MSVSNSRTVGTELPNRRLGARIVANPIWCAPEMSLILLAKRMSSFPNGKRIKSFGLDNLEPLKWFIEK